MSPCPSLSKKLRILVLLVATGLSISVLPGCTTLPEPAAEPHAEAAPPASRSTRREALTAIGLKPLEDSDVPAYMDRAQVEIEALVKNSDVSVVRKDRDLIVTLPGDRSFGAGSSTIRPRVFKVLDKLSTVIDRYHSTYIDILGHADPSGRKAENDALSEQRAKSTAGYLVAHNVAYQRLSVAGVGSAFPLESNDQARGRARNRRVEIIIRPLL